MRKQDESLEAPLGTKVYTWDKPVNTGEHGLYSWFVEVLILLGIRRYWYYLV